MENGRLSTGVDGWAAARAAARASVEGARRGDVARNEFWRNSFFAGNVILNLSRHAIHVCGCCVCHLAGNVHIPELLLQLHVLLFQPSYGLLGSTTSTTILPPASTFQWQVAKVCMVGFQERGFQIFSFTAVMANPAAGSVDKKLEEFLLVRPHHQSTSHTYNYIAEVPGTLSDALHRLLSIAQSTSLELKKYEVALHGCAQAFLGRCIKLVLECNQDVVCLMHDGM